MYKSLNHHSLRKSALLGASAVIGLTTGGAAFAQVFEDEVVVTAQKREESAQDVGISITTLSGEQMQSLGYTNAQEVTALAAGVATLQPNGEANYAVGIRGVANNDFTSNVESPVAIYVDETYISQMSGAGFLTLTSIASKFCAVRRERCSAAMRPAASFII